MYGKLNRAFTLIEILVVIAIIGILSSVLYANFNDARKDARNKSLQGELKEIQLALELYKSQNGVYPDVPACGSALGPLAWAQSTVCTGDYIASIRPDFTADLPQEGDSANTSCDIIYLTDDGVNSWYKLLAKNCHSGDAITQDDQFAHCPSSCSASGDCDPTSSVFQQSYAVYSAGGECQQK
ncbi:prepilin-type N-terminal cleavage/methylation domain-containing protein [Candidatus Kaiserbacteria bacterium]|nr:prepilin-type N-terminal cleavage/methylation domain-containing protein [Candidatus Kaiserbacteria bacterium]USN88915.1 MAG: prepilin-type N-terminal cleavage/methylation domain-containing protein [Candidatus Nomurabacteria bacterium]